MNNSEAAEDMAANNPEVIDMTRLIESMSNVTDQQLSENYMKSFQDVETLLEKVTCNFTTIPESFLIPTDINNELVARSYGNPFTCTSNCDLGPSLLRAISVLPHSLFKKYARSMSQPIPSYISALFRDKDLNTLNTAQFETLDVRYMLQVHDITNLSSQKKFSYIFNCVKRSDIMFNFPQLEEIYLSLDHDQAESLSSWIQQVIKQFSIQIKYYLSLSIYFRRNHCQFSETALRLAHESTDARSLKAYIEIFTAEESEEVLLSYLEEMILLHKDLFSDPMYHAKEIKDSYYTEAAVARGVSNFLNLLPDFISFHPASSSILLENRYARPLLAHLVTSLSSEFASSPKDVSAQISEVVFLCDFLSSLNLSQSLTDDLHNIIRELFVNKVSRKNLFRYVLNLQEINSQSAYTNWIIADFNVVIMRDAEMVFSNINNINIILSTSEFLMRANSDHPYLPVADSAISNFVSSLANPVLQFPVICEILSVLSKVSRQKTLVTLLNNLPVFVSTCKDVVSALNESLLSMTYEDFKSINESLINFNNECYIYGFNPISADKSLTENYEIISSTLSSLSDFASICPTNDSRNMILTLTRNHSQSILDAPLLSCSQQSPLFRLNNVCNHISQVTTSSPIVKYAFNCKLSSLSNNELSIDDLEQVLSNVLNEADAIINFSRGNIPISVVCECFESIIINQWPISSIPLTLTPIIILKNLIKLEENTKLLQFGFSQEIKDTINSILSSPCTQATIDHSNAYSSLSELSYLASDFDTVKMVILSNYHTSMYGFWNFIAELPSNSLDLDSKLVDLFNFASLSPQDADLIKAIKKDIVLMQEISPINTLNLFKNAFCKLVDGNNFSDISRLAYLSDTLTSGEHDVSGSLVKSISNLFNSNGKIVFFNIGRLNSDFSFTWCDRTESDIASLIPDESLAIDNLELKNLIDEFKAFYSLILRIKTVIIELAKLNVADPVIEVASSLNEVQNTLHTLEAKLVETTNLVSLLIKSKKVCSRFPLSAMLNLQNYDDETLIPAPTTSTLQLQSPLKNFVVAYNPHPWKIFNNVLFAFGSTQTYAPKPYQFLICAPYLFVEDIDHVLKQAHENKYTLAIMFPELLSAEVSSHLIQLVSDSSFTQSFESFVYIFTSDSIYDSVSTTCPDPMIETMSKARGSTESHLIRFLSDYICSLSAQKSAFSPPEFKFFFSKKPGEGKTTIATKWLTSKAIDNFSTLHIMDEQYAYEIADQLNDNCGIVRFSPDSVHSCLHASYLMPFLLTGGLYTNSCKVHNKKLTLAVECASVFDSSIYKNFSILPHEVAEFNIKEVDIFKCSSPRTDMTLSTLIDNLSSGTQITLNDIHSFKEFSLPLLSATLMGAGDSFTAIDVISTPSNFIKNAKKQIKELDRMENRIKVVSMLENYYLKGIYSRPIDTILVMSARRYLRIFEKNFYPTDEQLQITEARLKADRESAIERLSNFSALHNWAELVLQQLINATMNVSVHLVKASYFEKIATFMNWARYLVRSSVSAIKQSSTSSDASKSSTPVDLFQNDFAEINCPNSYIHLAPFKYGSEDKQPQVFVPCIQDRTFCSRDSQSTNFGLSVLHRLLRPTEGPETILANLDELNDSDLRYIVKLLLGCIVKNDVDLPEYESTKYYALTADNTIKIINILLKILSRQPVLLIGETGIGKTAMINFVAQSIGSHIVTLNCTANTSKDDIDHAIAKALELQNNEIDRTSNDVKRLISARKRLGKFITNHAIEDKPNILSKDMPKVIIFFDELNTCSCIDYFEQIFQGRSHPLLAQNPNIVIIGSANPWRFAKDGSSLTYLVNPLSLSSLSTSWDFGALEFEHETKICESIINKSIPLNINKDSFTELVRKAHVTIKNDMSPISVSLRDFHRAVNVYNAVRKLVDTLDAPVQEQLIQIVAIWISYVLKNPDPSSYSDTLQNIIGEGSADSIITDIYTLYKNIFVALVPENDRVGIAPNTAIIENFFVVMISIISDESLPLLLVGPPGSSKTYTTSLLRSVFKGKSSETELFTRYQTLQTLNFQGSKATTSAEIDMIFNQARNSSESSKQSLGATIPNVLIVCDELGLADKSPSNPLKTLHYQLGPTTTDSTGKKTGMDGFNFIGLSNDPLDAAKLNRCLYINRGPLSRQQLEETAIFLKPDMSLTNIKNIVTAYHYVHQPSSSTSFSASGLRDFYSLLKSTPPNYQLKELFISAIRSLGSQYKDFFIKYCSLINLKDVPFINVRMDPLELIRANLKEANSRHILAISFPGLAYKTLCQACKELRRPQPHYKVVTDMKADKLFTFVKRAMEVGDVICLSGQTPYLSALYTVLNRSVTIKDGKAYSLLVSSSLAGRLHPLHPDFKIILELTASEASSQDQALLNRLERYDCTSQYFIGDSLQRNVKSIFEPGSLPYFFSSFGDNAAQFLAKVPHIMDIASDIIMNANIAENSLLANISRLANGNAFVFCPVSVSATRAFLNQYGIAAQVISSSQLSIIPEKLADLRSGQLGVSVVLCYDVSFRVPLESLCPQPTDNIDYFSVTSLDGNFTDIPSLTQSRDFRYRILSSAIGSCIIFTAFSSNIKRFLRERIDRHRMDNSSFIDKLIPANALSSFDATKLQNLAGYYDLTSLISIAVGSYHVLFDIAKKLTLIAITEMFVFECSEAIKISMKDSQLSGIVISSKSKIVISSAWCKLMNIAIQSSDEATFNIPLITLLARANNSSSFSSFDDIANFIYNSDLKQVIPPTVINSIPSSTLFNAMLAYRSNADYETLPSQVIHSNSNYEILQLMITPLAPLFITSCYSDTALDLTTTESIGESILEMFTHSVNIPRDTLIEVLSIPLQYLPASTKLPIFSLKIKTELNILSDKCIISAYSIMQQLNYQDRAVYLNHFINVLIDTQQVHPAEAYGLLPEVLFAVEGPINPEDASLMLLGQSLAKLSKLVVKFNMVENAFIDTVFNFISLILTTTTPLSFGQIPILSSFAESLITLKPELKELNSPLQDHPTLRVIWEAANFDASASEVEAVKFRPNVSFTSSVSEDLLNVYIHDKQPSAILQPIVDLIESTDADSDDKSVLVMVLSCAIDAVERDSDKKNFFTNLVANCDAYFSKVQETETRYQERSIVGTYTVYPHAQSAMPDDFTHSLTRAVKCPCGDMIWFLDACGNFNESKELKCPKCKRLISRVGHASSWSDNNEAIPLSKKDISSLLREVWKLTDEFFAKEAGVRQLVGDAFHIGRIFSNAFCLLALINKPDHTCEFFEGVTPQIVADDIIRHFNVLKDYKQDSSAMSVLSVAIPLLYREPMACTHLGVMNRKSYEEKVKTLLKNVDKRDTFITDNLTLRTYTDFVSNNVCPPASVIRFKTLDGKFLNPLSAFIALDWSRMPSETNPKNLVRLAISKLPVWSEKSEDSVALNTYDLVSYMCSISLCARFMMPYISFFESVKFVDDFSYLECVNNGLAEYVSIPVEIGVALKESKSFVTSLSAANIYYECSQIESTDFTPLLFEASFEDSILCRLLSAMCEIINVRFGVRNEAPVNVLDHSFTYKLTDFSSIMKSLIDKSRQFGNSRTISLDDYIEKLKNDLRTPPVMVAYPINIYSQKNAENQEIAERSFPLSDAYEKIKTDPYLMNSLDVIGVALSSLPTELSWVTKLFSSKLDSDEAMFLAEDSAVMESVTKMYESLPELNFQEIYSIYKHHNNLMA